jgi:L-threonylcarbamoyladenylate synthase
MATIIKPTQENIQLAQEHLSKSNLVAVPTETVYGLAANALDIEAVLQIFKIKGRPLIDPLIVHVSSLEQAKLYCQMNPLAITLAQKYWPGPLTMVLPKKDNIPGVVTANLDSVAIRCPGNRVFRNLLESLPFPLAAPSANPFGYISPTKAIHVNESMGDKIDLILDDDDSEIGIESTIIDLRNEDQPTILRPGPLTQQAIEAEFNLKLTTPPQMMEAKSAPSPSPGLLKSHYSPSKPLDIVKLTEIEAMITKDTLKESAFIFNTRPVKLSQSVQNIFWLSESGEMEEIAKNLYALLRTVDKMEYQRIIVETIKAESVGIALMDRLTRASER